MADIEKNSKRKIVKKIFKILGKTILSVLLFVYVLVALLNTTVVQSFTAAKVADFFSKEWNTKFSIGALNVIPFIHAGIKDIYLEDQQGDTLLCASYIEANLKNIKRLNHIIVRDVDVEDVTFYMDISHKGLNFKFILDYFKGEPKPEKEKSKEPFVLEVKKINLENIHYRLRRLDSDNPVEKGFFASNWIEASNVFMKARDFKLKGSDICVDIKHFQADERCGVKLKEFTGLVNVSSKGISIDKGLVKTAVSSLDWDVSMTTDSYATYSSFIDSVVCKLNIREGSYVGLQDACHWTKHVQQATQKVFLSMNVDGTLADLHIHSFDMQSNNTHVNTAGKIVGLPHIDNTFFDLVLYDVTTSLQDYNEQKLGTMVPEMNLPSMIANLGIVNIKGYFDGSISNFVSNLQLITDIGAMDLTAQATMLGKTTKYIASITSPGMNVGTLLGNSMLGHTTLVADAELTMGNVANMVGKLKAKLNDCYFNGNSYNDVVLEGDIDGYDINAGIDLSDELADLSAKCKLNYQGKPSIQLDAMMSKVDLYRMNLFAFADTNTIISADINADIQNFDLDSLNGSIYLKNLNVITTTQDISVNNISLETINDSCENTISLSSDIIDADFTGEYTITTLKDDIHYLLSRYIPDISAIISDTIKNVTVKDTLEKNYVTKSDLQFTSTIKNIDLIKTLFNIDMNLRKPIDIQGHINQENLLFCKINVPDFEFSKKNINQADIQLRTTEDKLNIDLNTSKISLSDAMAFKDVAVAIGVDSSEFNLLLKGSDFEDDSTNARVQFNSYISDKGLQGNFTDTYVNIQGERIFFNDNHIIGVANKNVSLMNFAIMADNTLSKITIDGLVSKEGKLNCNFSDVDLSLINPFLESTGLTLSGVLNKDVELKNLLGGLTFTSNLEADDLVINEVELGKAWLNVDNKISPDVFNTHIRFLYKAKNKSYLPLQLVGTIAPKAEEDQLDLTLHMKDFELAVIKTFISSFASDVEGSLSCDNLTVKGKISSPEIKGVIKPNKAAMRINMLNTKYWFNDDINIDNNKITFEDFKLRDAQGNKITINGDVAHHNFSSFDINLHALADKIKILDTKEDNGQMYYGTAYASANMTIKGDSTMINISGSARTEPGTSLVVPVSSKASAEEHNFITFVSNNSADGNDADKSGQESSGSSMGYNISIDLNVNPNAKLFIPMDFTQLKGDLAAAGNGDLKIEMNSNGKFSMVGTVAIDNGNFKFNIMDIMEKSFVLEQGGTLVWEGEPAGGVLDVTAIYKTKTSLSSLLGASYSKPVDVESIIHLTGQMTNPIPSFDIQLPNTDEQTAEQVFMQIDKTDEKVMLEQTASILLTNQFYYSQGGYETSALQSGVASSVMGVAFSQLSGMLTNMVKFVDVGLNYTSGGETLTDQVDLNLSKSFGKWEISVNSTFGGDDKTYTTSDASNIIGDVTAEYKYTDNLRFELFNHSNANDFTKYNVSPYTQGTKVTYKKEYDSVKDIFRRKKKNKTSINK